MRYSQGHRISAVLVCLLMAMRPVASAEPIFEVFKEVCLQTNGYSDRIAAVLDDYPDWNVVAPSDQIILKELVNNRTWQFRGDMELGIVVAGDLPMGSEKDLRLCMFAAPRGTLTIKDASQFLIDAGGQPAVPAYDKGDSDDVFFGLLLEADWLMVGVHMIPAQTHLQIQLMDMPDDEVKAAIRAAEAD